MSEPHILVWFNNSDARHLVRNAQANPVYQYYIRETLCFLVVKKAEAEDLLVDLKNGKFPFYTDHEALDTFFKLAYRNLANPEEVELHRKR